MNLYVIKLEKCSNVTIFLHLNKQIIKCKVLFNNMFRSSLYSVTGPLRGGRDADVGHGENELEYFVFLTPYFSRPNSQMKPDPRLEIVVF